jgi:hypothetical protein
VTSDIQHIHIVSFNVPYPPNYGGVIDVFYKIKALHDLGIKVHLHTFHYGREEAEKLNQLCEKVYYYPRQKFYQAIYSRVPYIVGSRQSDSLLSTLIEDDYPILFEGLHTCFYLSHPSIRDRFKIVRMHNIEWDYYNSLGKAERNFFRKFYFYAESKKLKEYEEVLRDADLILGISASDTEYLGERFKNVAHLPAFHHNTSVNSQVGYGEYALYHGNLSVQENNQAAIYLTRKIFDNLGHSLKIAGRKPSGMLQQEMKSRPNFELITEPDDDVMASLIGNAHINVLPTFQATGVKLKLINALFNGRFCVVNKPMIENTGLESLCYVCDSADEMKDAIKKLFDQEFTQADLDKRIAVLEANYSNAANAKHLMQLVWPALSAV